MPVYMLAADHRGWLLRALAAELSGRPEDNAPRARRVKQLCFEAVTRAVEQGVARSDAALLIDEELGGDVALRARKEGLTVAIPIEKPDQDVFEPEYGEAWMEHVASANPDLPKVLIRHNPGADRADLDEQLRRLREVADALHAAGRQLMLELLVPATPAQLHDVGGDEHAFDERLRPELTLGAVHDLMEAGIRAEVWKVEGMPTVALAERLARACASRGPARCLVLGRNAGWEEVEAWLRHAAASPGYDGFAIGRTLWWQACVDLFRERISWDEAVTAVAEGYRRCVETYASAATEPTPVAGDGSGGGSEGGLGLASEAPSMGGAG